MFLFYIIDYLFLVFNFVILLPFHVCVFPLGSYCSLQLLLLAMNVVSDVRRNKWMKPMNMKVLVLASK